MKYFAQLTNEEQLMILERLVTILKKDMNSYTSVYEAVDNAINSKLDDLVDTVEIRVCDECGKIMVEGYCIDGGMEYYCSDECLHKNYTKEQWLAIYAGLDDNDPAEVERAAKMTSAELDELNDENDSQSYHTAWEV
ncbi:hypothetical protein SDC9_203729 [bioreactor metagenome]|uniref:Uncharacterized protein n=1 Tax=bioreactor metagenome TaxID=1076179 RepID=A0A645J958_9ZZZZ